MNRSISSSIEDYDSIESKTVRKSLKQISTVSIKSISEIITEHTESSENNLKYSENFETTSNNNEYSESFESSDSFSTSSSSPNKSDSTLGSISSDLGSLDSSTSILTYLNELRKTDYIKFVRAKIEMQQKRKKDKNKKVKTHNKQIKKLIGRVNNWSQHQAIKEKTNDDFKIDQCVINRLKTKNFIKKLGEDHLKRVEALGEDTVEKVSKEEIEKFYYKEKCDLIRFNTAKNEFETNHIDYCDGIIKIGILARDLPKLSDDPDLIWAKLLEPLKISSNNYK